MGRYIYNRGTGTLHIENCCPHATIRKNNERYVVFATEDEALAYDGRAVRVCKTCQQKRDKIVNIKKER